MTAISPLAPARFPDMPPVPGVRLAAAEARLRYKGRPDLLLGVVPAGDRRRGHAYPLAHGGAAGALVPGAAGR